MDFTTFVGQTEEIGPFPESQRGRKAETGHHQLFGGNLYRKPLPSFGPTALDDNSSVFRGHPNEETVGSFSTDVTGLECSFHGYYTSPEE
jgi:hypothetical protein